MKDFVSQFFLRDLLRLIQTFSLDKKMDTHSGRSQIINWNSSFCFGNRLDISINCITWRWNTIWSPHDDMKHQTITKGQHETPFDHQVTTWLSPDDNIYETLLSVLALDSTFQLTASLGDAFLMNDWETN